MSISAESNLLAAFGALYVLTGVFATICWRNLVGQISELKTGKVDKEIYNAAQVSLIQDMRELKRGQDRMATTLEEIKLSLAVDRGAKEERERLMGED